MQNILYIYAFTVMHKQFALLTAFIILLSINQFAMQNLNILYIYKHIQLHTTLKQFALLTDGFVCGITE